MKIKQCGYIRSIGRIDHKYVVTVNGAAVYQTDSIWQARKITSRMVDGEDWTICQLFNVKGSDHQVYVVRERG